MEAPHIPVVLFAYARPDHLRQVLASLRENGVPLLYVFSDGARNARDAASVAAVRRIVREIDWCEVRIVERPENLGLGRNVLGGVSEVAARHEAFVVWEDDLVATPGAYAWVVAGLRHYAADPQVMSVTAWTHPRVTPAGLDGQPYLDGRAECWVWGAWSRSWKGMTEETARQKLALAVRRGIPPDAYGSDLPAMAREEQRKNIWAVRWLYHHLSRGGLCLRPPWSMVEHIGFDPTATNAASAVQWANPPLRPAPGIPTAWPAAERPECRPLWHAGSPRRTWPARIRRRLLAMLGRRA